MGGKKIIEEIIKIVRNIRPVSPPLILNSNQNITETTLHYTSEVTEQRSKKKYTYVYDASMSSRLGSTINSYNNPNVGTPMNLFLNLGLVSSSAVTRIRYNKPPNFRSLNDFNQVATLVTSTTKISLPVIDEEKHIENNNNYILSDNKQVINSVISSLSINLTNTSQTNIVAPVVNTFLPLEYTTELLNRAKIYYDFSNNNNAIDLNLKPSNFCNKTPQILSNLSGLMSLDSNFRLKLTDELNFKVFARFYLSVSSKIIWTLFSKPYNKKEFVLNIFNCFSLIQTNLSSLDEFSRILYMDKYISTVQHILTIVCNRYKIDVNTFLNIFKIFDSKFMKHFNIDFSHYKEIPVNVIIEFFIFYQNMKYLDYSKLPRNVQLIDHTHAMFNKTGNDVNSIKRMKEDIKIDIFQEFDSMKQTSQMHCDIIFHNIEIDSLAVVKITDKIYRDIKADYRGPLRGHYTIKPFLFTDRKKMEIHISDYISAIKDKIKLYPVFANELLQDFNILKSCIKESKEQNLSIKNTILNFSQKILEMAFNSVYINIGINFTLAIDVELDEEFIYDILPQLKSIIEKNSMNLDILFPQDNKIHIDKYQRKMIEIIEILFPDQMKSEILQNYKKFIEDDNK